MPFDSFTKKVKQVLADPILSKISMWEIGNEVNGGWLGQDVTKKIRYAADAVKASDPSKNLCVTFFWYSTQDTMETSLFNWIDTNVLKTGLDLKFDCVGLSLYTAHEPLGFLFDLVSRKLAQTFPGKKMMIGETDFVDKPFREGPAAWSREQAAAEFLKSRYTSAFAIPNSFGGVFWWSFEDFLLSDGPPRKALREVYCQAHPDYCLPTEK